MRTVDHACGLQRLRQTRRTSEIEHQVDAGAGTFTLFPQNGRVSFPVAAKIGPPVEFESLVALADVFLDIGVGLTGVVAVGALDVKKESRNRFSRLNP